MLLQCGPLCATHDLSHVPLQLKALLQRLHLVEHGVDVLGADANSVSVDVVPAVLPPKLSDCAQGGLVFRAEEGVGPRQPRVAVVDVLPHVSELAVDNIVLELLGSCDAELLVVVALKDGDGDEHVGTGSGRHELPAVPLVANAVDVLLDGRLGARVDVGLVLVHAANRGHGEALDDDGHC